ncbi:YhzD family protein [Tenuibacillus multivorans]|uniref:YhzD-like protein n=1 Tax=Tenuibacillus multivorans TaxID=237069 RepID=A0A1H0GAQ4_9BACI|nr:YhzD family protein [Tenuibacillus multivorans]GEL78800.1 hypothetical protein TMU01_30350 [Tenuibacillus multivorans]SDO03911.1 YhzD-like protein [Tenuibacillus multivorans]
MKTYYLTVYANDGEALLDEQFKAENDDEAKALGTQKLKEYKYEDQTHRCVSPDGRLLLFHR